jgi:PAS domain S-box-containing protein
MIKNRILVVDDDVRLRTLFKDVLMRYSIKVVEAGSGKLALEKVAKNDFDLVFVEAGLPDTSGVEVMNEMLKTRPALKIVLMTGQTSRKNTIRTMKIGAIEYLTKPFDLKHIHRILRQHLFEGIVKLGDGALVMPKELETTTNQRVFEQGKVLVVAGQEALCELITGVIEQAGCEVKTAVDYKSTVKLMGQEYFNLVIADVNLEGQSGLDLLKWVKANYNECEVVLITISPKIETISKAMHWGAFDFIVRPFPSLEIIMDTVRRALTRYAIADANRKLTRQLKQQNFGLELLYKISSSIGYSTDYDVLVNTIMQSLAKIMPFDLAVSLIVEPTHSLSIYMAGDIPTINVEKSEKQVFEAFSMMSTQPIEQAKCKLNVVRIKQESNANEHQKVRSTRKVGLSQTFFNVPILVNDHLIGMINISSLSSYQFSEADVRLLSTIANQMAQAIERIRWIVTSEKSKMEMMVENMVEGVMMLDERGAPVIINPRARKALGLDGNESDAAGEDIKTKMHQLGLDTIIMECHLRKEPIVSEITLPHERKLILRCEVSMVGDGKGKVIGTVIVLRDITHEKEVDRMKSEFVSTVSHELRTPMTIIRESVSQVMDGLLGEINEGQKKNLMMSQKNIDRLSRIINELLDISKIEAGKVVLKKQLVDVVRIARDVMLSLNKKAAKKGLKIVGDFSSEKLELYADRDKLVQVFTNLVANAIAFTKKGGIRIFIKEGRGFIQVSVSDTGKGISQQDMPQIFEKFQQFERTAGAGEKGTGLGLTISRSIVEMHQGRIGVESKLGGGTTFRFILPKYTILGILRHVVSEGIIQALENKSSLSVAAFELRHPDERLKNLVLKSLRVSSDMVFKGQSGIYAVLPATAKKEALAAVGRIRLQIKADLGDKYTEDMVACKVVGFPEDGRSAKELLWSLGGELMKKKQVLIVDNEPEFCHLLANRLNEEKRFECHEAGDGADALKKMRITMPDIIICDIRMPRMNGFEFMDILNKDPETRRIPVIVLTSFEKERARISKSYSNSFSLSKSESELRQAIDIINHVI